MSDLLGRLAELTGPERARLMARLRQRAATSAEQSADPTAASDAQQRLWLLQRLDPGSPAHHLSAALHLAGPLDAEVLHRALTGITARHESLRTGFREEDGRPVRHVVASPSVELPLVDLADLPSGEAERRARALHAEQGRRPFELDRAPLARFTLYRLTAERHVLTFVAHHLVCDGWSMGVFTTELVALYEAFAEGRPSPLPPSAAVPAGERRPTGEERDRSVRYWREELSGDLPVLELPTDRPRSAPATDRGARHGFRIPVGLHQELRAAAGRDRATVYGVQLPADAGTLHRITRPLDLVVGAPLDAPPGAAQ
ncbi:condensation domain-containing protein, partial [Streptomyces tricolor]